MLHRATALDVMRFHNGPMQLSRGDFKVEVAHVVHLGMQMQEGGAGWLLAG